MKSVLPRPIVDKMASLALLGGAGTVFTLESPSALLGQLGFGALVVGAAVNAAFVFLTPVARMNGRIMSLYSEAQPVVFDLRPKQINLQKVRNIIIDRKSIYPRAILCLVHGERVYHGFPSRSEERIKKFCGFIGEGIPREEAK